MTEKYHRAALGSNLSVGQSKPNSLTLIIKYSLIVLGGGGALGDILSHVSVLPYVLVFLLCIN